MNMEESCAPLLLILPVELAGKAVAREAELVLLGFFHGVFSHFRIGASEHHGGASPSRVDIQIDLPVVLHRRGEGVDQGLAGLVERSAHLHAAGLHRPPVHHRQRELLLLVLQIGVGAQGARLILALPPAHVEHKGALTLHFGDIKAFPGHVGTRS